MNKGSDYTRFLIRSIIRGLLYFGVIILIYFIFKHYIGDDWKALLEPFTSKPLLMYGIFFASETFFGIIPPEFFIIWALQADLLMFILQVALLAILSFTGGYIAYFVGKKLYGTQLYQKISRSYWGKYVSYYRRWGGVIIIISCLTPLPYATISLISGAFGFPNKKYFWFASVRFLRFVIYGFTFWHMG